MWKAFDRLTTTRPRGTGIGPISYREVMFYADDLELSLNVREFLWEVIKRVDAAYLRLVNDKLTAERKQAVTRARQPRELPNG